MVSPRAGEQRGRREGVRWGPTYKSESLPQLPPRARAHTQARARPSTHAPVCGCFIAGRLSHKCHTNLHTSYLMSKPVRYIAGLTASRCSTYAANVCAARYQVHTGEGLLLKGSLKENCKGKKKHFITQWYPALIECAQAWKNTSES